MQINAKYSYHLQKKKIVRGQCYPILAAKLSSPIAAKLDLFRIVLLLSVDLCDRCRTHVQHFRLIRLNWIIWSHVIIIPGFSKTRTGRNTHASAAH